MKYQDGTSVCLGDHIWWNEGSCIGYISAVVETQDDQQAWEFEEPHFLISCNHPYNPDNAGEVAYSVEDIEDEGIERLTPEEEDNLARAIESISHNADFSFPLRVGYDIQNIRTGQWVFGVIDSHGYREIARVSK
jgi:hypothetical protein